MRDLAVFVFLIGSIAVILRRPWTGVLVLAIFSYLNPHAYAWGFMRTFPVYFVTFLVAAFALFVKEKERQTLPNDWRIPLFLFLWAFFLITTLDAAVPGPAWAKLKVVSKIYLPLLFTLWFITTRQKLDFLIFTIAASFALPAAKAGVWAIGTGFAHRVWGPDGTQFYGNNEFAIAILMSVPLQVLWMRETSKRWLRLALQLAIPLSIASALSSWSRGALLTVGVLSLVLIWHSKRKYLAIPLLAVAVYFAPQYLPEDWFGRMRTIETYEEDASAMSRIQAWQDGLNYVKSNPLTGAGFDGWIYVTQRDWHSSYVEILSEHGVIAFSVWISLLFGTIVELTMLPRKTRHVAGMEWVSNRCYMLRASLLAYATGALTLGISYWDLLYHVILISALVRKFALEELAFRSKQQGIVQPRGPQGLAGSETREAKARAPLY